MWAGDSRYLPNHNGQGLVLIGGRMMRLQLFKGTYAVLILLAVPGLFLMLRRQAGDGYSLSLWLGLVALAAGGLVATGSEGLAFGGAAAGLLTTLYLRLTMASGAGATAYGSGGQLRIDLALGAYVIFCIALTVIWGARRRARGD